MRDHRLDSEVDDSFSLHGLAIYSHDSSDCSSNSLTSSEFDDDKPSSNLFEFVTTDFPSNNPYEQIEQIMFCGKSIPSRTTTMTSNHKTLHTGNIFNKIKQSSKSKRKLDRSNSTTNSSHNKNAPKIKWYTILFGLQKNSMPTKIDLADMRSRQSKLTSKSMEKLENCTNNCDNNHNSRVNQGLLYLIRSLSCRGTSTMSIVS